jgi:hypothetical protein
MESVVRTSLTQFVFLWNTVQMQALQNVRLRESSVYLKTQEAYVNKITLLKYPDLVLVLYEIYFVKKLPNGDFFFFHWLHKGSKKRQSRPKSINSSNFQNRRRPLCYY